MSDQPRPTPRTDAVTFKIISSLQSGTDDVVLAEFAKTLEQESDAREERIRELKSLNGALTTERDVWQKQADDVLAENAKLREALESLAQPCTRADYSAADLDRVVTRLARQALAGKDRVKSVKTIPGIDAATNEGVQM